MLLTWPTDLFPCDIDLLTYVLVLLTHDLEIQKHRTSMYLTPPPLDHTTICVWPWLTYQWPRPSPRPPVPGPSCSPGPGTPPCTGSSRCPAWSCWSRSAWPSPSHDWTVCRSRLSTPPPSSCGPWSADRGRGSNSFQRVNTLGIKAERRGDEAGQSPSWDVEQQGWVDGWNKQINVNTMTSQKCIRDLCITYQEIWLKTTVTTQFSQV